MDGLFSKIKLVKIIYIAISTKNCPYKPVILFQVKIHTIGKCQNLSTTQRSTLFLCYESEKTELQNELIVIYKIHLSMDCG